MRISKKMEATIRETIHEVLFSTEIQEKMEVDFSIPLDEMSNHDKQVFDCLSEICAELSNRIISTIAAGKNHKKGD